MTSVTNAPDGFAGHLRLQMMSISEGLMGTVFGDSAHEILPGLWVGDCESAAIAIPRDFAVLNVLETGAMPGEVSHPNLGAAELSIARGRCPGL